ncbi:MAG TPA: amidohydrolase family protein, partial [Blastocatellia bacterium]|nr:amidohydrolase family protein [Blastocatellia bacterium]
MDRLLDKPRNTPWLRLRRKILTGIILLAVVFGIGALPPAFVFFMQGRSGEEKGAASRSSSGSTAEITPELRARRNRPVAFINVNLVPMDREAVIPGQTVVVKDGVIAEAGPADEVNIPSGALKMDGRGKYLMPGLADMHVHLRDRSELDNRRMLLLFVANGVTTVMNLHGTRDHLDLRSRVAKGELLGPAVFTSGPFISNAPYHMPDADEVERMVIDQKQAGYDIVKIHGDFSREAYRRLFEVTRREGMRVIGHAPRNLGIEVMLEERQEAVAHAEEYLYAYFFFKTNAPPRGADREARRRFLDEQALRIPVIAEATAKAGTWVVPNLTAYKGIGQQSKDVTPLLNRPEMKYVPPSISVNWQPENNSYVKRFRGEETAWAFQMQYKLLEKLVRGFRDAGVRMMTGTDTAIPSVIPGFSVHDELKDLVAAGLTPYEALRAATIN